MFCINFHAYGGESQEYRKWVFEKYRNLLKHQTFSKNSMLFQRYNWFFEAILYKLYAKPRLAKVSK